MVMFREKKWNEYADSEKICDTIAYSSYCHRKQTDKLGKPYIFHPIEVMRQVCTIDEKVVALLHDVVEDTPATLEELEFAGFPRHIILAVNAITKRDKETNYDYIQRVKLNKIATTVKYADLAHNSSKERQAGLDEATQKRLKNKYKKAKAWLDE